MRYLRYFLTISLIALAIWIVSSKFREVYYDVPLLLREANKPMLAFLFLFQAINYLGDGWLCRMLLGIAGFKVDFIDTLKIAVLGVVGNHVAPFVGGTLVSYRSYKKIGVPSAAISFLVLTWAFLVWITYLLFFLISLLVLSKDIFLSVVLFKNLFLFVFISIILILGIFLVLFKKKYSFHFLNIIFKPAIKIANFFFHKKIAASRALEKFIFDISRCFNFLSRNKKKIPRLLFFSSLYFGGDILTLYFAFLVFGFHPNLALLILGYTISSTLTLATMMPGAPGVTEASMAIVFMKFGLPAHVVLFSVLLYRIFAYWIPLPLGAFFYFSLKDKNNLNSKDETEES